MDALPLREDESNPGEDSIHVIAMASQWRGPLPPPDALEYFDRIVPGSADRILRMAEQQQTYRMEAYRTIVGAEIKDASRGHYLGFTLAISAIAAAVVAAYLTDSWEVAVAIVGLPVLTAAYALIHSRRTDG